MMLPPKTSGHHNFHRFWIDDSGAVTVDWVVLTAAVVGLVLMVFTIFTPEVFAAAIAVINGAMGQP